MATRRLLAPSTAERLRKLEGLLKQGLITQQEYDQKRTAILADI
jgi:hypothetical protein